MLSGVPEVRAIVEEMEELYRETGIGSKARFASIRARLGDWDKALEDYEDAFQNHDTALSYLGVYVDFWLPSDFVAEPRFQDLLRRMNFPEREDAN